MKIFFLFAVLFASTEANHGKHKKKKNKQSGEAVHFEAKQNYECEWDELTYQGLGKGWISENLKQFLINR